PLERTSTRKVKRPLVVERLRAMEKQSAGVEKLKVNSAEAGWLFSLIAQVSQRPAAEVTSEARLTADLGFDSLLLTELSAALEAAGLPLPAISDLSQVETVGDRSEERRVGRERGARWWAGRGQ